MYQQQQQRRGCISPRLILALVLAAFALISYYVKSEDNPIIGRSQKVSLDKRQETALGLQSAPQMVRQHGGESRDPRATALVEQVGRRIIENSDAGAAGYRYDFHLLADPRTVNAFALPGGQVFITVGMLAKLRTEGELAGVLAHEIAHVVARHGAEHLAKQQLTEGLVGATAVGGGVDSARMAAMVGNLVNLKYSRHDESESDVLGVRFMSQAGYDPRGMIGVMQVLQEASRGGSPPEFFSTHPNPENRVPEIEKAIATVWPNGVPDGLVK